MADKKLYRVALVGNPNTGKSTLFNALSGLRQRIGNYPGVTVDRKIGSLEVDGHTFELIDLPGTYSLAPQSPDEMVTVDVLLGHDEAEGSLDAIVVIVDASNLERNLYLVSQVLELECPTLLALNMTDVAESRGVTIDCDRLKSQLNIPVVRTQANRRRGIDGLRRKLVELCVDPPQPSDTHRFPSVFSDAFQQEVSELAKVIPGPPRERYLIERLLLDSGGYLEKALVDGDGDGRSLRTHLDAARQRLAEAGQPVPAIEAIARYGWVDRVLEGVVTRPLEHTTTRSDRIDRVLTHKIWGSCFFVALMLVVFQSVFRWAVPAMGWIEAGGDGLADLVRSNMADGALRSLLCDGIIGGVGGVVVFLPQIFILFFFIAILEDCGYMARAAYLMDKLMVRVGLSGKSFIPLLSSFACAVPGIMAARVIENRRDRLTTILIAPLMSCSARLPVYILLIAAIIPNRSYLYGMIDLKGLIIFSMYALGVVVAILVALVLKKSLLKGETPAFVMELPGYKMPSVRVVLHRMFEQGWAFVRRAGTVIFAVAVVVWAAGYYPRDPGSIDPALSRQLAAVEQQLVEIELSGVDSAEQSALEDQRSELRKDVNGSYLRHSYLGTAGQAIEPLVRPLGWDWRIGCAAIASFPAREVVVGTLGVIYNLGDDQDEESVALHKKLRAATWDGTDRPVFNIPVAMSLMVFFALCAQCAATLAVIRRETGSWRWPIFSFAYMTTLAYLGAWATYRIGMML